MMIKKNMQINEIAMQELMKKQGQSYGGVSQSQAPVQERSAFEDTASEASSVQRQASDAGATDDMDE